MQQIPQIQNRANHRTSPAQMPLRSGWVYKAPINVICEQDNREEYSFEDESSQCVRKVSSPNNDHILYHPPSSNVNNVSCVNTGIEDGVEIHNLFSEQNSYVNNPPKYNVNKSNVKESNYRLKSSNRWNKVYPYEEMEIENNSYANTLPIPQNSKSKDRAMLNNTDKIVPTNFTHLETVLKLLVSMGTQQ